MIAFASVKSTNKLEVNELGEDPLALVKSIVIKPLVASLDDTEALKSSITKLVKDSYEDYGLLVLGAIQDPKGLQMVMVDTKKLTFSSDVTAFNLTVSFAQDTQQLEKAFTAKFNYVQAVIPVKPDFLVAVLMTYKPRKTANSSVKVSRFSSAKTFKSGSAMSVFVVEG